MKDHKKKARVPHPAPLWWGPPKKFSERKHERKIGWLELFYDLVYVAAISQLTHQVAVHPSWPTVGYSFLIFSFIFWSWVNGSQYYDLHGSDSIRTRILTFWQMLAMAAVAITISDAFDGNHHGLAVAFMILQCIIAYLWWSVGMYDPAHRKFDIYYTVHYISAFIIILISFFTSYETATWLWLLALLFNFTPPLTAARTVISDMKKRGEVFTASAAIVERFGLFTIIVLAESILAIVTGVAEVKDKQPVVWIAFIIAILIAFLLWSIYFDMTSEQETKKGYSYMQWLMFLHFPLLASLSILGACIKVLITDMEIPLSNNVEWIFSLSLSIILFMISGITRIMEEDDESRSYIRPVVPLLIIAGILILLLPLLRLSSLAFLSCIAVILFVPVFVGIRHWVKYQFFGKNIG